MKLEHAYRFVDVIVSMTHVVVKLSKFLRLSLRKGKLHTKTCFSPKTLGTGFENWQTVTYVYKTH